MLQALYEGPAVREHLHQRQEQVQEPAGVRMLSPKAKELKPTATLAVVMVASALSVAQPQAQVPRLERVVLAEVPYIAVTTCVDQLLRISGYLVLCNDYSYPYHYGAAVLIAETWAEQGRKLALYKLCLDGHSGRCLQVDMLKQ